MPKGKKHESDKPTDEDIVATLRSLLSYTKACEDLLNANPSGQVRHAEAILDKWDGRSSKAHVHLHTGDEYLYNDVILVNGEVISSVVRLSHFYVDGHGATWAVCLPVEGTGLQDMFGTNPKNLKEVPK